MSEENKEVKEEEGTQGKEGQVKTYTEKELQDKLQSETDKRVTEAVKKREQKLREEMKAEIDREVKETERLAKLSADEREKDLLEKTRKDIEKREMDLQRKELLADTKDLLHEKKIPTRFADMLIKQDAETTMETVKVFEGEWQSAIEEAVNERLKGKGKPLTGEKGNGNVTKEQFKAMSYKDRLALKQKDSQLYDELIK